MEAQHPLWRVQGANRKPHAQRQTGASPMSAPFASTEIAMSHEYSNPLSFEHATGMVAGAQQATGPAEPAIDRQSLEKALKWWDDLPLCWQTRLICEAARKHLETLPKPAPPADHVVVVRNEDGAAVIFDTDQRGWMTAEKAEHTVNRWSVLYPKLRYVAVKVS